MANPLRRIVIPVSSSTVTAITGSIYKVCTDGSTTVKYISSASFGWQNQGVNQLDPGTPIPDLKFELNTGSFVCVEADFTYISCSIGTHVYIKTNGSQGWDSNVS
jgi:hypothetical protein